jgi:hypothetical protein
MRKARIEEVISIPEWLESLSKTMKVDDPCKNQKQWSMEVLASLVDHPGIIKLFYLHSRTYESFTMVE